jgi:hypothetical protein
MDDATPSAPVASHTAEPAVPREVEFLRQFLSHRDFPCPMCEYNLRDLVGNRCPECGDQLVLVVNPVEPKQAAVIAGLILLAMGAGMNGLLLIFGMFLLMTQGAPVRGMDPFFYVNGGGFAVEGLAIGIWIKEWKRIRRLPMLLRWSLCICFCGFLTIADLVIFTKYIR